MTRKVISVFAGLGKTTVGKKYSNVCDLMSSPYRCDYSNISTCDYEKMKYDSVPSSLDVRTLLLENNIPFLFVLPSSDSKTREKLLQRYKDRGNNEELIKDVMYNFDNWSRKEEDYPYPIAILEKEEYLEDLLLQLNLLRKTNRK